MEKTFNFKFDIFIIQWIILTFSKMTKLNMKGSKMRNRKNAIWTTYKADDTRVLLAMFSTHFQTQAL